MPEPTLFAMQTPAWRMPADSQARHDALDTGRSVLVEAPAGAGKTDLLTQRYLALLAEVEAPEQILAITFTRAAAAEMRSRVIAALAAAHHAAADEESGQMALARGALAHAEALGWQLLEQPHRLAIETIDSLCLRLAHAQPLLARLGGRLTPAEDAEAMYRAAARRTLALLRDGDTSDDSASGALRTLLLRRDNSLQELERMLAAMLASRAEWMGVLPFDLADEQEWAAFRSQLEEPFAREHSRVLMQLASEAAAMPALAAEWLALARGAAANLGEDAEDIPVQRLRNLQHLPGTELADADMWLALSSFLVTKTGWRKRWTKTEGFPAPSDATSSQTKKFFRTLKDRMAACCADMQAHPHSAGLWEAFCALRCLPPLHYTADQWTTLRATFIVLRRAVAELQLVFAEANQVDFTQLAQAADAVLNDETSLRGLLESERTRHLLIDEFQDTSRAQFSLVAKLLHEWVEGDGRTAFVVGDPLQSIYGFRQAEVALFHETREHGLPCGGDRRHRCRPLHLTHNFRSHHALVEELNGRFARMFAGSASDRFVPSTAWPSQQSAPSFALHTRFVEKGVAEAAERACDAEADEIASLVQAELPRIAAAEAAGAGEYRVAVLVRTRTHLRRILPALREAGIPYRAVDLEPLSDRPEVYDLLMLLRALLHPAERAAWLSVLRAPWCGLSLADLHLLAGDDDRALLRAPLPSLMDERAHLLSTDGRERLEHTWAVLGAALRTRYTEGNGVSLATWIERTWIALGGPACVTSSALENVESFWLLLDELSPSGEEVLQGDFASRLARLCAKPDAQVSERFGVQVMTMHKAKGLGFEVVILPALERQSRADPSGLLTMLLRARRDHPLTPELLLAPVGDRDDAEKDPAQAWVRAERRVRDAEERKRLFYVACTRARTRLHLFATLQVKDGTIEKPKADSLLGAAWPALCDEVEAQFASSAQPANTGGLALAASAETHAEAGYHTIERLPTAWRPAAWAQDIVATQLLRSAVPAYGRAGHASPAQRVRGTALHALLERLSAALGDNPPFMQPASLQKSLERTARRVLREGGYALPDARDAAAELARIALGVLDDPVGRWLLSPHAEASAENAWQSVDAAGAVHTLRVDRSFVAGDTPLAAGSNCVWVVDYKAGKPGNGQDTDTWLEKQREAWSGQLAAYALALQPATAAVRTVRCGLYFPELRRMIDWSAD